MCCPKLHIFLRIVVPMMFTRVSKAPHFTEPINIFESAWGMGNDVFVKKLRTWSQTHDIHCCLQFNLAPLGFVTLKQGIASGALYYGC